MLHPYDVSVREKSDSWISDCFQICLIDFCVATVKHSFNAKASDENGGIAITRYIALTNRPLIITSVVDNQNI